MRHLLESFSQVAFSFVAFALVVCVGVAADVDPSKGAAKKVVKLPEDPNQVVIELDFKGGQIERMNNEPPITIFADGKVILASPYGQQKRTEVRLGRDRVQEIMEYVLIDQQLDKFDADKMKAKWTQAKQAGGLRFHMADGATTVLRIYDNNKWKVASVYGLSFEAKKYPQVEELTQLQNVSQYLMKLKHEINAGGKEGIAKLVAIANKELKAKHPDVRPLAAADLQYCNNFATGRKTCSLGYKEEIEGDKIRYVYANLDISDPENPKVKVSKGEQPKPKKRIVPQNNPAKQQPKRLKGIQIQRPLK